MVVDGCVRTVDCLDRPTVCAFMSTNTLSFAIYAYLA